MVVKPTSHVIYKSKRAKTNLNNEQKMNLFKHFNCSSAKKALIKQKHVRSKSQLIMNIESYKLGEITDGKKHLCR